MDSCDAVRIPISSDHWQRYMGCSSSWFKLNTDRSWPFVIYLLYKYFTHLVECHYLYIYMSIVSQCMERPFQRNLGLRLYPNLSYESGHHLPEIVDDILVVQFVAESRFANCEFANLFFDFDESQFSRFQKFSQFITKIIET